MQDEDMRIADIEVKFSPPDPRLDRVSGLRHDPGGWVFRLYDENGRQLVGGAMHGADDVARERAVNHAANDARRKDLTHFQMVGESNAPIPL
ncbi:hypothetical protein [Burkholderia pyrrocinia]|uniref:hypothetical protein n=1 Tax=Burkholderia pyrrocinia TaxID=60550 RepID=UPI001045D877|nr:hypothetical protein [Burkholderia pyrrocinia]TDA45918.1 hypothetical protein EVG18_18720 [Burkholderia pyrrocinia]